MRRRRMSIALVRRVSLTVALVLIACWPLARSPLAAAQTTSPPVFGEPTISGIQGNGFEEDIRLDRAGRVYTSSPGSLSSTISWVWRSLDGGKTFKWVPAAVQPAGKLPTCAGGGDSELATDSANHLYFNDLTLAN